MNIHVDEIREWEAVRRYLTDRLQAATLRRDKLELTGRESAELAEARFMVSELERKLDEHEKKAP